VRRQNAVNIIKQSGEVQNLKGNELLEFAIVPDMTIEGAFDEAMKGVWGVVHTAGAWPVPVSLIQIASKEPLLRADPISL
jgi:hypothetical protein